MIKIAIVSDSAAIDTGFGRVAREIGTGLQLSGKFHVRQLGWFHNVNDRLVPFGITPTAREPALMHCDKYGELSYDPFIEQYKPDIVLVIGDEWMVKHIASRPRNHKLIGYVPIDSAPIKPEWLNTFRMMDLLVVYGGFAEQVIKAHPQAANLPMVSIPHGVDRQTFHPLSANEKRQARSLISPDLDRFIVGCVARNNTRKQLPRLLKAFRMFINPWSSCQKCGKVDHGNKKGACSNCLSTDLNFGMEKKDALLYIHAVSNDSAGHDLISLIHMLGLRGYVGLPDNMRVGCGVPDTQLNHYYNAFDVFTLPTSGEGWGLPILEAMSVGCPVLVTEYSAHTEFVHGAGEFIRVAEWDTCEANNGERALVDIEDYAMKLDRMYYPHEDFMFKWRKPFEIAGLDMNVLDNLECGALHRNTLGMKAIERAEEYEWGPIIKMWINVIESAIGNKSTPQGEYRPNLELI